MNKGITLVEWLVIVAIVAILAAFGVGAYKELHPKIQRNSILATNGVIGSEKVLERFTLNRQLSGFGLPDLVVVQDTKEHEEYLVVIFHEHLAITPLLKASKAQIGSPIYVSPPWQQSWTNNQLWYPPLRNSLLRRWTNELGMVYEGDTESIMFLGIVPVPAEKP